MTPEYRTKLVEGLKAARTAGIKASLKAMEEKSDCGTCNFDAPAIKLPRGTRESTIRAICEEANVSCFKWDFLGRWVIMACSLGQADANTRGALAAEQALQESGIDTTMYYQMD